MAGTAHTPGQWTTDDGDSDCIGVFAEDGNAICYLSDNAHHGSGLRGRLADEANAHLLSAALDAYKIISDIAACVNSAGECRITKDNQFNRILNYLAKAEGGSN